MDWDPGPRTLLPLLLGAALLVPAPPPAATDAPRCLRAAEKPAAEAVVVPGVSEGRAASTDLPLPSSAEGGSFGL